ncbi:serine hydrolase domain-containing protein [Brevundimonas sp.]|uniref:serine hydrolase domain-containing protein n=1 Tax=Brevundimonas sp. TaxID=1871086 RepID=UPI002D519DE9|nr:serine hydrolase domain-containing protein [Brevundimonas sp.]HYC96844.1 serine hydrolase domain-containing protein [Brevundimonas sp.]
MISRRGVLAASASLLGGTPALGSPPTGWRDRVSGILSARGVPGAAVVLVKDGQTVIAEAFGLASVPFAAPATPRSLFHLGSVSKQFTSAVVVQLAEEGRLALDAPIGRYVRDLPDGLGSRPVEALLSHTAGVPDYYGQPGFASDRYIDRPAFIAGVAALPGSFAPGEAWAYSNTGYVLLGYLIADVTGLSYHEAVRTRLLAPAGLTRARFDAARSIIPGRAEPYVLGADQLLHAVQMDSDYSGWPDGGLLMSGEDGARWERALQAGTAIRPATLARMTTPVRLSNGRSTAYGYGWFTDQVAGQKHDYHSGSVDGFLAYYVRNPGRRAGALVMVNMESSLAGRAMRDVAHDLLEMAAPGSTVASLVVQRDDAPALTRQARDMVFRNGTPLDHSLFTPEMAPRLGLDTVGPPDRGAIGAPAAFSLVESFDEPGGLVRRYRASYADRIEHFAFAYAPDDRIYRVRAV